MDLKGWNTKKKPDGTKINKIIYVIKIESVHSAAIERLPGFVAKNGRILDWERKNEMPLFQKFNNGSGMKNFEIIAWQEFPELSEELEKQSWNRPFYLKFRT